MIYFIVAEALPDSARRLNLISPVIAEALPDLHRHVPVFLDVLVRALEEVLLAPYVWILVEVLHVRRLFVG